MFQKSTHANHTCYRRVLTSDLQGQWIWYEQMSKVSKFEVSEMDSKVIIEENFNNIK